MASPGYPQMQQNPMMGGGMHNNMMPPRAPAKRGVSKAVPVVVSAGLAVGVFCGLLFGLGTGDQSASAGPAKGNNLKAMGSGSDAAPVPDKGAGPAGLGATAAAPPPKATGSATGSGSGSNAVVAAAATGSGAGSGSAAKPTDIAKLTIEIEPAAAASVAKIQIDGKDMEGTSIDLPADKKNVKVSVTATGYHSIENKKVDVTAGSETKVQLELTKRASGGSPGFGGASTGGNHVPTAPPHKKPSNNGIIDI
jgi:hypothetical protein